jgi:dTDP-glucose pyrophosphorylase
MKSWRKALVGIEFTLEQAIIVLDNAAMRIALIVDKDDKLLGTLTDGDVRRALLKHLSLDTPVSEVMNSQPRMGKYNWSKSRIHSVLEKYELLQLPMIDSEGRVIGMANITDSMNKRCYDNPVFLMAGGFGTRLRPLTNNCPKPMLTIGDKPILEKILLNFIEFGFHRFYISTHYLPGVIRDYFGNGKQWGVSIQYVQEEEPLGTGGSLGLLPHDEIDQHMFMMNGDLLTSINLRSFLEFHKRENGIATMCVLEYEHQVPYGVITSEGVTVKSMIEKPVHRFFVNAGIYLLDPTLVKSVLPGTYIDMPTLLEREIKSGKDVNMFPIHENWLDIGRMDDFQKAQNQFSSEDVKK